MSISAIWEPFSPYRWRSSLPLLVPAAVAIAYYAGAQAAFAIGTLTEQFAPFWPPNVVLFCAFLLAPPRVWPFFIVAAFPAHVVAERGVAMPMPQLLVAFACNVSVALLNAIALTRLVRGRDWFGSLRNAWLYLLFAVLLNPALVACAAGLEPTFGGGALIDYSNFWWRWYLSNALGNLTLTPLFLAWAPGALRWPFSFPAGRSLIEAVLLAFGLLISCAVAFEFTPTIAAADLFPTLLYLPIPLLIAAAVRFGAKGASGAIFVFTLAVIFGAVHGHEPFAGNPSGHGVFAPQLFLAITAIPVILLAALFEELRRSNSLLGAVLDGISDCYFTLDLDGRITAANAKGATWCGAASSAALIGRSFWEVIGKRAPEAAWVRRAIEVGVATHAEMPSSKGRWVDIYAHPSCDGLSLFCHDITERKLAEIAMRDSQNLLQSSLDALTSHIAILDGAGRIIAANAAWLKLAARFSDGGEPYLVGSNYIDICERAREHQRVIAGRLRRLIRGEIDEFRYEYPFEYLVDSWFQMRGTRFGSGSQLRVVVAHEDITEVKRSEDAMRRLTGRLMRLQDEGRRQIARELHDSTAQNLLGAMLGIGQALRLAPGLNALARAALEESHALIEESQREIRTVSYLLHPPMLDEAGLPAALRWLSDGFAKRTEIRVDLDVSADFGRLSPEIEAALFRITQEALTNVHRHSGSRTARIWLKHASSPGMQPVTIMAIEDDGRGMPTEIAQFADGTRHDPHVGIGLTGMRERLHQFGGYLQIRSGSHGTTVCATVPSMPTPALGSFPAVPPKAGKYLIPDGVGISDA